MGAAGVYHAQPAAVKHSPCFISRAARHMCNQHPHMRWSQAFEGGAPWAGRPVQGQLTQASAVQDKELGPGRKRGAPEAEVEDLPDDVRQRLDAIKSAA